MSTISASIFSKKEVTFVLHEKVGVDVQNKRRKLKYHLHIEARCFQISYIAYEEIVREKR